MALEQSIEGLYGDLADTVEVEIAGATFIVRQCDQNSVEWMKVVRRLTKPYNAMVRRNREIPMDTDRKIVIRVFVEVCLAGWRNLRIKTKGDEIVYSADTAVELFEKYGRLFTDLMTEAQDIDRFRKSEVEDVIKN